MKKFVCLCLCVVLCFPLASCGKKDDEILECVAVEYHWSVEPVVREYANSNGIVSITTKSYIYTCEITVKPSADYSFNDCVLYYQVGNVDLGQTNDISVNPKWIELDKDGNGFGTFMYETKLYRDAESTHPNFLSEMTPYFTKATGTVKKK